MKEHHIGKDNAIKLYESGWWNGRTAREIVGFQLFTAELCMPFGEFHKAVEEVIGRPVFTHEFGLNVDGIRKEFLGESTAPTLEQIINLIPENKLSLIILGDL